MSALDVIVGRLRAAGCVFAEDEAALLVEAALSEAALEAMVRRRVDGVPLEYVVGFAEFCGLRIAVDEGVFVPRQRTRLLVRHAAAFATAWSRVHPDRPTVVVDLACGSGAVGAAVLTAIQAVDLDPVNAVDLDRVQAVEFDPAHTVDLDPVHAVELYAVDVEPRAVACARRNLALFDARVYLGDLFEPLPRRLRGDVAVLVANVPYVPSEAVGLLPPEAREHEPLVALDGGPDGLDVMRRVAAQARRWLAPGGQVLVETGTGQVPAALAALADGGLAADVVHDEELYATIVIGRAP
jgi:release factor glutamine methyltransferase